MELTVPGDKSITHRALILGALAAGRSRVSGALVSEDTEATVRCLRALGAAVPELSGESPLEVGGRGRLGLREPRWVLDCRNSGTTARLLLGVLAGQKLEATLSGDASLRTRPMGRVVRPLRTMGASFEFLEEPHRLPVRLRGARLSSLDHQLPVASAQVKSALLLAGFVGGVSVRLWEPGHSRDHTERLLRWMGAHVVSEPGEQGQWLMLADPPGELRPLELAVPGDFSSAAFLLALGLLGGAGGEPVVVSTGLNQTRTGLLSVARRMGAGIEMEITSSPGDPEPSGVLAVTPSDLKAAEVGKDEIPGLIDEIPVLAVLAARASGVTRITGAEELRVKESDRIQSLVENLRAVGVGSEELPDGLEVEGTDRPLRGQVRTHGDHRIAMAFGVLGALPGNRIELDEPASVEVSFPPFWDILRLASSASGAGRRRPGGGWAGSPGGPERRSRPVITIDGPAGSGKSTTAMEVARRLGYRHLDSGALYRAITFALLERGVPEDRWPRLAAAELDALEVRVDPDSPILDICMGSRRLRDELRSPKVTAHVSLVASLGCVREWLLDAQREAGSRGGLVAEGRDMGTVVFPDAEVKVYLVADLRERARRRLLQEGAGATEEKAVSAQAERLDRRDRFDSGREIAPLRKPPDAIVVDTTNLTFDQQVERIVSLVRDLDPDCGQT